LRTHGAGGVVNKSWLFRFSIHDENGPHKRFERWMQLGPIRTVSLVCEFSALVRL
jgi:hypothetical protein